MMWSGGERARGSVRRRRPWRLVAVHGVVATLATLGIVVRAAASDAAPDAVDAEGDRDLTAVDEAACGVALGVRVAEGTDETLGLLLGP